jgi:dienelactone hydrolase
VEKDPEGRVDFGSAIFSDATDELVATVYTGDRQRIYPKDPAFEEDLNVLQDELDGQLGFQSSTEDESTWIVSASSDVDPGSVYRYDRASQTLSRLYRSRPDLPSEHLADMEAIRYEARDGLEIPAYLTLPKGVEAENLPLVVYVHGGPWARDTWGYDAYAQFFANRGYAVLQANFRGSTGYGKDFLNAGNKEWGEAMQNDLTDGVQYLVDRGTVHPERVGIFGGSYGGYATLAGLAFTPDVYTAGASYVGPSNLITLLNSIPPYWASFRKQLERRVGDPDDPADRERMKQQSPLFSAQSIDDPLLVIQGANDPRVKKQESDQIVVAARENDLDVEYLVAPEEGHGFAKENNRLAVAARLEAFFGEHLGGRSQTDVAEPVQARLDSLTVPPATVTLPDSLADAASDTEAKAQSEATVAQLNGAKLQAATLSYDVGMSMGGRSMNQSTTRAIAAHTHDGAPVWIAVETTSGPMGTVTDSVVVHRETLRPIARSMRGPLTMDVTYGDTTATGTLMARGQEVTIDERFDRPTLAGGANLDLALAGLPLEPGYSATLQTFSPRQMKTSTVTLNVTGTETVETAAGTFEAYVVDMTQGDQGSGTLYVKRDGAHYVVKADVTVQSPRGAVDVTRTLQSMEPADASP